MNSKIWITGFLVIITIPLTVVAFWVVKVDPYFHYHKPCTSIYYYPLNNERSQNDGILRHFDYEGLLTGTSMTECFKTSEAEELFGCNFVKVPFSGATYKEINDNLEAALAYNRDLKIIIRGLDMNKFIEDKDAMRYDMGEYPTYLYNRNLLDDVKYVFNRDVNALVYSMTEENDSEGFEAGIDSFDSYVNWMSGYEFGVKEVFPGGVSALNRSVAQSDLTEEEKEMVMESARQNITSLAESFPDVTFYYFFTPYSAAWWQTLINTGAFNQQLQAERIMIEEILKTDNIKLYSFNNMTEITTDLNNYKDSCHYAEWINSLMLRYMKEGKCLLTKENYEKYLKQEKDFYWSFDYEECFRQQEDYEEDYYAAEILNQATSPTRHD